MTRLARVTAGFMPLMDSAIIVIAKAKGFAETEGIDLHLVRETSWASMRDRMAVGQFQVAHTLGPIPIACNLGLTPLRIPTIAPMALGIGGNAVTVSNQLWSAMRDQGATDDLDPTSTGAALARVVSGRASNSKTVLRFGVVHPHSGHNYELRYWLAASGIDPERQIEIVILPPPLMPDAIVSGAIDGYCVGEPWNTAAALQNVGHIATVKAAIWRSSPEKVLGVAASWATANPDTLDALLRALCRSAEWCGVKDNVPELAAILADEAYVARPVSWLIPGLTGNIQANGKVTDFFLPFARAATFPWKSHALWFYSQMVRWRQIAHTPANVAIARDTYRPDLYRAALKSLGIALPVANSKVEGALLAPTPVGSAGASLILGPDGFFDGGLFDPDKLDGYVAAQVGV